MNYLRLASFTGYPILGLLCLCCATTPASGTGGAAATPTEATSTPHRFVLSSFDIPYALKGRIEGVVSLLPDSIVVQVERGSLTNNMKTTPNHIPLYMDIRGSMIVAAPGRSSWQGLLIAQEVPLIGVMQADTTVDVIPFRIAFARPSNFRPDATWLTLRVTSKRIEGSGYDIPGHEQFSVYLCSDEFLGAKAGTSVIEKRPGGRSFIDC